MEHLPSEDDMNGLDNALRFHQSALNLRSERQAVIASNIANADTPNYKARDFEFGSALQGALQGRASQPMALSTSSKGHVSATAPGMSPFMSYRKPDQASADGNTVDMDVERAAFAENALHYEASITFINGLLRSMQQAVSGSTGG